MLYAITYYDYNNKIYVIHDIFKESSHNYSIKYNGALSQFDITEKELNDKYDIHIGVQIHKMTEEAREFFTEGTNRYKQEELNVKSKIAFNQYNESRSREYLLALLEHEAYNAYHFKIESEVLNAISLKREISVEELIEDLMQGITKHNNTLVDFDDDVNRFSHKLDDMDFYKLFDTNIEDFLNALLYDQEPSYFPIQQ